MIRHRHRYALKCVTGVEGQVHLILMDLFAGLVNARPSLIC